MTALLDVAGLGVTIDRGPEILRDVNLCLAAGERLGLVGESGCGKSMTALAIMGLLPEVAHASGQIRLAGQRLPLGNDGAMAGVRGKRIAMIFQEPMTALNPVMTIGRQIAEAISTHLDLPRKSVRDRSRELLSLVGMPPERFSLSLYPHQLSGGQRQRVMIATALACEPDILIADEPTTALDVTVQIQILALLKRLSVERGMALLLVTHDLGVVAGLCGHMAVMYAGRIVETGLVDQVFSRLAHPYTRGLMAAVPADPTALASDQALQAIPGDVPAPSSRPPGCPFHPRCGQMTGRCRHEMPLLQEAAGGYAIACHHPYNTPPAP